MKIAKLLLLFLIPAALLFMSCKNEVSVDFIIELDSEMPPEEALVNSIDYFKLTLFDLKYYVSDTIVNYILDDEILYRGDILRLENLDSGKYVLWVDPYQAGNDDRLAINTTVTSNKMTDDGYIIIDDESPTIVKIILKHQP